jgi:sigma-E factor negative regulatory protein RseC
MDASVCIEQKGTIEAIANNKITVRVDRASACGQCNIQGICNLTGPLERTIDVKNNNLNFSVGDVVQIAITRTMGNKAILFGYLLPFILLIATLLFLTSLSVAEWIAGLVSLAILAPYYLVLYLLKDKLSRTFTFTIRKKE